MIKETFDLTNHTDGYRYEMQIHKFIDEYFQIFALKEKNKFVEFEVVDNTQEFPTTLHFNTLNQLKCFIYNSFELSEGLFRKSNLH